MTTDNAMDPKAPLAKPIYELQNELTEENIRTELTRIANLDNEEDKVIGMMVLIRCTFNNKNTKIIPNSNCFKDLAKTNEAMILKDDGKLEELRDKADQIIQENNNNEKQTTRIH